MNEILPWAGLGFLLLLCLPIHSLQHTILDVSAWVLRIASVSLLVFGVYLWFRPGELPDRVSSVLADFPGLLALLPDRASPMFGLCLACWLVALLVPLLAVLDVTRRRLTARKLIVTEETREVMLPIGETVVEEVGVPILRPIERRTAAAALAGAGTHSGR